MTTDEWPTGLRELGTAYVGKEPLESVADLLRSVTRLAGAELGFESCLTSRPFTSRTYSADRPGSMQPGRPAATENRAEVDLLDALRTLSEFRYRWAVASLPIRAADFGPGRAIIVGPVRVDDRWCPHADRLLSGAAWRYLMADSATKGSIVCFDAIFGGYSQFSQAALIERGARVIVVQVPSQAADAQLIAARCLRQGCKWRAAEPAQSDRDGPGLALAADCAAQLIVGAPSRRTVLSLQSQALQSLRWATLLGQVGRHDTDTLALADVLHDSMLMYRAAHKAAHLRQVDQLAAHLSALARLADATTELSDNLSRE